MNDSTSPTITIGELTAESNYRWRSEVTIRTADGGSVALETKFILSWGHWRVAMPARPPKVRTRNWIPVVAVSPNLEAAILDLALPALQAVAGGER